MDLTLQFELKAQTKNYMSKKKHTHTKTNQTQKLATNRLTTDRSTTELLRNNGKLVKVHPTHV